MSLPFVSRLPPRNIDQRAPNGETLLLSACRIGSVKHVNFLLDHGANAELTTTDGFTPLLVAVFFSKIEVVRTLLQRGVVNVNATDLEGMTALMWATASNTVNKLMVSLLIDHGANLDAKDLMGYTAVFHAVNNEALDIIDILIRQGSQVNDSDFLGMYAWEITENPEIVTVVKPARYWKPVVTLQKQLRLY